MPLFKLAITAVALLINGPGSVDLSDGGRITKVQLSKKISASFDGRNELYLMADNKRYRLSAGTPSRVVVSPSENYGLLNFGNGSGQVLDIEIIQLGRTRIGGSRLVKRFALNRAGKSCPASYDAISVVFDKWLPGDRVRLHTEDFSRTAKCAGLFHTWDVSLARLVSG